MGTEDHKTLTLSSGAFMPVIGLGTWKSKPGEVKVAVEAAIDSGYRHIDCAHLYGNETEIGSAIKAKIEQGVVTRNELFITSKLWPIHFRKVEYALNLTLQHLNLEYLDLYLMHWPFALYYKSDNHYFPSQDNGSALGDDKVHYLDVWKELEALQKKGLAKHIGISNFNIYQMDKLLKNCEIPPAVHQFELHPYLRQEEEVQYCQSRGIVVTGYSPFGSPDRPWAKPGDPTLLENPIIKKIGALHRKTSAQVILRYLIQRGVAVVPKSVSKERIKENVGVFDFSISEENVTLLDKLDRNWRALDVPYYYSLKYYPFSDNYKE